MVTGFAEIIVSNSWIWIWRESVAGQKAVVPGAVNCEDHGLRSSALRQAVVGI